MPCLCELCGSLPVMDLTHFVDSFGSALSGDNWKRKAARAIKEVMLAAPLAALPAFARRLGDKEKRGRGLKVGSKCGPASLKLGNDEPPLAGARAAMLSLADAAAAACRERCDGPSTS